jgi:hypothetical protein
MTGRGAVSVALMHALCITGHILVRNRLTSRQSSERGLRESDRDWDLNAVCRHYIGYRTALRQAEADEDIVPPRHLEEYSHGSRPIFRRLRSSCRYIRWKAGRSSSLTFHPSLFCKGRGDCGSAAPVGIDASSRGFEESLCRGTRTRRTGRRRGWRQRNRGMGTGKKMAGGVVQVENRRLKLDGVSAPR